MGRPRKPEVWMVFLPFFIPDGTPPSDFCATEKELADNLGLDPCQFKDIPSLRAFLLGFEFSNILVAIHDAMHRGVSVRGAFVMQENAERVCSLLRERGFAVSGKSTPNGWVHLVVDKVEDVSCPDCPPAEEEGEEDGPEHPSDSDHDFGLGYELEDDDDEEDGED